MVNASTLWGRVVVLAFFIAKKPQGFWINHLKGGVNMRRKKGRRFQGRSYRSADSKRQRLRKEAQKRAKYSVKPLSYNNMQLKQSRQRGA